ncbi:MAG: isocitrate lyase/phosphoenolpyruvate mutase family protein, partial [Gammaproteobacteria bacterium]
MADQETKTRIFRELHQADAAWIIPNPWDIGSAKLLQGMGFVALATTSSGFAFSRGRSDGEVSLDEKLDHCREICQATDIPVNADFEDGYSANINTLCDNIHRLLETGIAGFSIEDFSREQHTLMDMGEAVERVRAAAETVATYPVPVMLTARAENLLRGVDDVDDTIARLQAFSKAGADVLYAPGVKSLEQLTAIPAEIDKPFTVLEPFMPTATVAQF